MGSSTRWWPEIGDEPDPRWSLANERTLLAYQRTALGLVVAGFAIVGSHAVSGTPAWFAVIGLPLVLLGGAVAREGRRRFGEAQLAMRQNGPMPAPRIAAFLPNGVAFVALAGFVLAVVELVAS